MSIYSSISKLTGKVKSEYGYFKAGVREAIKNNPTVQSKVKENQTRMKNIREGNPEKNLLLDKYR